MQAFNFSVNLYRRTFKRFAPIHSTLHWLTNRLIFPLLEKLKRFKTMPDDPAWFRLELLMNWHERETTSQLDRLLQPGMTMLDIGAHVGYYTHRYAPVAGHIIAFEPHPRNFALLQQNTERFDNVTLYQIAVAEETGSAKLYDYLMMSASGSLHYDETLRELQQAQVSATDIAPRLAGDIPMQTFTVDTRPIDDCLAEQKIQRVDVIKMDIEGAEMGALRGMRRTIANSPGLALVMEYNPNALQAFGHSPHEALHEVIEMGFNQIQIIEEDGTLTTLNPDETTLDKLTSRLIDQMGVVNLLLTHRPLEGA